MSDEDPGLIEKTFITELGAKFPFVSAKGVNEKYGVSGFPSIYVIDPDGTIVSVPEDRMPSEAFIEEHLAKVSLMPKLPEDSRFDPLRTLWKGKEHKKIGEYLAKMLQQPTLDAELRTVYEGQQQELQKRQERAAARVTSLGQGPDFYAAERQLESVKKEWAGLPPADAAKAELDRFAKDGKVQNEIAASKALEKLLGKFNPSRVAQRRKLAEELAKFAETKKYFGTEALKKASALAKQYGGN